MGEAGLPGLLVREPTRPLWEIAQLVDLARRWVPTVWLHVRTPADDEVRARVDGLHLPDDPTRGPPSRSWGRSCHHVEDVRAAWSAGASWAFLSPIHAPTSKPGDGRAPLGAAVFAELAGPVYALGGQTPERHRTVRAIGATGSAVLGDLWERPDPDAAAERVGDYLRS
jgi:thiamine monophosphate synthase